MEIYIEDILLSNSLINIIMIKSIGDFFIKKINTKLLIFSSILGGCLSLIFPLFYFQKVMLFVVKFLVLFLMLKIVFFDEKLKNLLFFCIFFAIFSFFFSGFSLFLGIKNTNSIYLIFPFLILYYLILKVYKIVKIKIKFSTFYYKVIFFHNNKKIESKAFLDSGNTLKYNNNPLMIVNLNFLLNFYNKNFTFENGRLKFPFKIIDKLSTNSVNMKGEILITKIDKIILYNNKTEHIFNDILVGINLHNFDSYDLLISIENLL